MNVSARFIVCFASALTMVAFAAEPQKTVSLGTNVVVSESASGSADLRNNLLSGSIEHVECILNKMQRPFDIRSLPWRRARQDVRSGGLDGFFTAAATDSANQFAQFSSPLVLESWNWYWRSGVEAPDSWKSQYQIGTILGSQQESILAAEGYDKTTSANSLDQLMKLLMTKRVDVILVDQKQFERNAQRLGIRTSEYQSRFFRYMPLGVYFSNRFLNENPGFLVQFNQHVQECTDSGFKLTKAESSKIREYLEATYEEIKRSAEVEQAFVNQKSWMNKSKAELDLIDKAWQEAAGAGKYNFSDKYLLRSANQYLDKLISRKDSVFSEIIITNAKGYNVAISPMTTDFWQGDENKFLKAYNLPMGEYFEDLIVYDASSHKFAVQFSTPLYYADGRLKGVVTFGVDVYRALSKRD